MIKNARVPILGFAAFSGTGKTTLLVKLLPLLRQRNLRVGVIKHAPHGFDIDRPGKDSYEIRQAGATQTLIGSSQRWALVTETQAPGAGRLDALVQNLDQDALDCVLVEGFRDEAFPKIELYRTCLGHPLMCVRDRSIIAVASDGRLPVSLQLPVLDLNDPRQIADFVYEALFGERSRTAVKPTANY